MREVKAQRLSPARELDTLIRRFTAAYANAAHEHRVLTEDVKFLRDDERAAVAAGQRRVVAAFSASIARLRPDLAPLATPLAMLLFGMINWTFTWMKPGGALTHDALAPIVAELFFGGLPAVTPVAVVPKKRRPRSYCRGRGLIAAWNRSTAWWSAPVWSGWPSHARWPWPAARS